MKKRISKSLIILFCMAFVVSTVNIVHAGDEGARTEHYAGEVITSSEEARTSLEENTETISEIMDEGELDGSKMETIHEISYTLEKAADKLVEEKAAPQESLEKLEGVVKEIHDASENHELEALKEKLAPLKDVVTELNTKKKKVVVAPSSTEDKGVENKTEYTIVIKDHQFLPETTHVPAGKKIKLIIDNQDSTPEEFESYDMNSEQIIAGSGQATVYVGPLKPGKYHFFGEFHMSTANGYVIAE